MYEGYIESFLVTGVHTKQLSYRKRTSKAKALAEWNKLIGQGWRVVKDKEKAA